MNEKRLEILERASAVYMKYGIKSVTMDDLARELGISKKTIYKYFTDKDELIKSMIEMKVEMDSALCRNCQLHSDNAIDDLIQVSKLVVEHLGNVNPIVFYDLKKYHPEAWSMLDKHKWGFVLNMIRENIERGIGEEIYRADLDKEVAAKLYVFLTDAVMNPEIFPWPEFKFNKVFSEMIRIQLKGFANEKGIKYLQEQSNNEQES